MQNSINSPPSRASPLAGKAELIRIWHCSAASVRAASMEEIKYSRWLFALTPSGPAERRRERSAGADLFSQPAPAPSSTTSLLRLGGQSSCRAPAPGCSLPWAQAGSCRSSQLTARPSVPRTDLTNYHCRPRNHRLAVTGGTPMSSGVSRGGPGPSGSLGSAERGARWRRRDSELAELSCSRAALRAAAQAARPGGRPPAVR